MRARVIWVVTLVALAVLPGALSARAAPSEQSASDRIEVRRLAEVHERLERRRALQEALRGQMEALTAELETLAAQRATTWAVLQAQRQQARALEQRLDRLVPRLLARTAEVDQRRAQAAGMLADLARKSRSVRLDPRIRARMLALSPVMLERLRSLEHGPAAQRGRPDRMIARHAQIERSLPALVASDQRLQHERAQKSRLRQVTSERLRELEGEMRLLDQEQARLARGLLRQDAVVARAEPPPDRRALRHRAGMRGPGVAAASVGK